MTSDDRPSCPRRRGPIGHHDAVDEDRRTGTRRRPCVAAVAVSLALVACTPAEIESGSAAVTTGPRTVPSDVSATSDAVGADTVPSSVVDTTGSTTTTTGAPVTTEPGEPVVPLSGWAAVDQYLEVALVRNGSPAAAVAVLRDGELVHEAAYGMRSGDDPVEPGDRFRVASISKTITAITVLQLVEDGLIGLDDPVGGRVIARLGVAAPTAGTDTITVRQLLAHRSGFPQYEELMFRNQVGSCAEAAVAGFSRPLETTPGTRFRYSNLNFCVLGIVVEELTGRPYEDVVRSRLLEPLGITGMRLAGTFDVGDGDVEHRSDEGRNYMEVLGAAGAWIASPTDIVRILDSIDPRTPGFAPLQAATLEQMKTITVDPAPEPGTDPGAASTTVAPTTTIEPPTRSGYGLGLMILEQPTDGGIDDAMFGHTGTLERTHAMTVRRPDGLTWALTVSGDHPASTRTLATIMDNAFVLGGFVDGEYQRVPPPSGS